MEAHNKHRLGWNICIIYYIQHRRRRNTIERTNGWLVKWNERDFLDGVGWLKLRLQAVTAKMMTENKETADRCACAFIFVL